MNEIEEASRIRRKAIEVLTRHEVIDALNWAMSNNFYTSDKMQVTAEKREDGEQQSISFLYEKHSYRLIRDEERHSTIPDDEALRGNVKLFEDAVLVFEGRYERKPDEYFGYRDPRIVTWEHSFKSIRLGDWVRRLPRAIEHAKNLQVAYLEGLRIKHAEEEARNIRSNFDLGNFENFH